MELSPQAVRTTGFKTVRKGYDPDEVDAFKERVATAVEQAQNQSAAMEARARAAVAKLQEVTSAGARQATPAAGVNVEAAAAPAPAAPAAPAELSATDAENISRTLLLAQRTADSTVAAAKAEAEALRSSARNEAASSLDAAKASTARMLADAKDDVRRATEDERVAAESEVQALLARRDFLVSDVDYLEQHIEAQRERLREAATSLQDLVERVPGGLGVLRRPLLSASDTAGPARESAEAGPVDEPGLRSSSSGASDASAATTASDDTESIAAPVTGADASADTQLFDAT